MKGYAGARSANDPNFGTIVIGKHKRGDLLAK